MRLPAFYRWLLLVVGLSISGISLAQDAGWPRQIQDSRGVHTLDHKPARIVSTSVTLTGSLLAIDAPVVASGATTPNNRFADDQGFMRQWSDVAKARHVARLYIGEPNAETVAAQMPDLILISATGGDSALALYDQLSAIAPTLDDKSWRLLTQLGEITGQEKQAAARIAEFEAQLTTVKQRIPAAHSANLWTPESTQGKLLTQVGFTLATLHQPESTHARGSDRRHHCAKTA